MYLASFESLAFDTVLEGSLFRRGARLIEPLRATIQAVAPGARRTRLAAPPVMGAGRRGLEQAGATQSRPAPRLAQTAAALLNSPVDKSGLMG